MAFSAQITRAERLVGRRTGASAPVCRPSKAVVARAQSGAGRDDICDPPNVYQQAPEEKKVVQRVQGEDGGRQFEAPTVEQTIVQHEVERVKPVIHQEIHQTRLNEVTHHKRESPVDMGITQVVQHGDTDPCGNPVVEDLNAVRGQGTLDPNASTANAGVVNAAAGFSGNDRTN